MFQARTIAEALIDLPDQFDALGQPLAFELAQLQAGDAAALRDQTIATLDAQLADRLSESEQQLTQRVEALQQRVSDSRHQISAANQSAENEARDLLDSAGNSSGSSVQPAPSLGTPASESPVQGSIAQNIPAGQSDAFFTDLVDRGHRGVASAASLSSLGFFSGGGLSALENLRGIGNGIDPANSLNDLQDELASQADLNQEVANATGSIGSSVQQVANAESSAIENLQPSAPPPINISVNLTGEQYQEFFDQGNVSRYEGYGTDYFIVHANGRKYIFQENTFSLFSHAGGTLLRSVDGSVSDEDAFNAAFGNTISSLATYGSAVGRGAITSGKALTNTVVSTVTIGIVDEAIAVNEYDLGYAEARIGFEFAAGAVPGTLAAKAAKSANLARGLSVFNNLDIAQSVVTTGRGAVSVYNEGGLTTENSLQLLTGGVSHGL